MTDSFSLIINSTPTNKTYLNRPSEGIKVGVWDEVLHAEDSLLEALDDLSESVLKLVLVRLE